MMQKQQREAHIKYQRKNHVQRTNDYWIKGDRNADKDLQIL